MCGLLNSACGVRRAGRDPHYDLFSRQHGRQHADSAEYRRRLTTYRSNALRIVGHNADAAKPFRMAINRFADWSEVRTSLASAGMCCPAGEGCEETYSQTSPFARNGSVLVPNSSLQRHTQ